MIQEQLTAWPNATLDIVEPVPSAAPAISSAKEGHGGLDFTDYVGHIDEVGGDVRADRRRRPSPPGVPDAALLDTSKPAAIIVFDNTMRRRYRQAIAAAPVVEKVYRGLTPTLPYPDQTSILRRK